MPVQEVHPIYHCQVTMLLLVICHYNLPARHSNLSNDYITTRSQYVLFVQTKGIFKIHVSDHLWQEQIDVININLMSYTHVKQMYSNNTQILLNYYLHCTTHYYGEQCKVYCKPNNTIGHYKCDSNGTEICLEGYSEDTNCTKGKD